MTTIAFHRGVIACDTMWSHGDIVSTYRSKITRLKSGGVVGFSGSNDARPLLRLLQNVRRADDLPLPRALHDLQICSQALLVLPSGEIFVIGTVQETEENGEDSGVTPITLPFWAIGAGSHLALGAMDRGASAVQAVRTARKFDLNTAGPIRSLRLRR